MGANEMSHERISKCPLCGRRVAHPGALADAEKDKKIVELEMEARMARREVNDLLDICRRAAGILNEKTVVALTTGAKGPRE